MQSFTGPTDFYTLVTSDGVSATAPSTTALAISHEELDDYDYFGDDYDYNIGGDLGSPLFDYEYPQDGEEEVLQIQGTYTMYLYMITHH